MIIHDVFDHYAAAIAALPRHSPLSKVDLLTPTFLLHHDALLDLYFAPFEYVNVHAKVALVGITPGWYQTELAFRVARDALRRGVCTAEASALARQAASFSGPIRSTLVGMLDTIGVHTALGIDSCWALWAARQDLLHTTALVRYPLFVGGQNYTGYKPNPLKTPLVRHYLTEVLADELRRTPQALIVPLGRSVNESMQYLAREGLLDPARLLPGLPHPSGANAHRHAQFAAVREQASAAVQAWFGA